MKHKPIIIAGPCAAESKEQILASITEAKKRSLDFMRISLWKPRTKPGFDGLGESGIELLIEAAKQGVNPGTEVLVPEQAKKIMQKVFKAVPNAKLLLWIGSRNQNHYIQREIAKIAARDERVTLLVKNQPWISKDHWNGIIDHVLDGGMPRKRLLLCHRGFTPNGINPHGYRNMPDFGMAMDIKQHVQLPMLFDPSHTGGTVPNVFRIAKESAEYAFDGLIIEVHHNPKVAITDAKQQITWKQLDELLDTMHVVQRNTSFLPQML